MNRLKKSPLFQLLIRLDEVLCGWWNNSFLGRWLTCQDPECSVFTPARQLAPKARGLLSRALGWVPVPGFPIAAFFTAAALILAPIVPNKILLALVCLSIGFTVLLFAADRDAALTPSPLNVHIGLYTLVLFWSTAISMLYFGFLPRGILFTAFALFFYCVTSSGLERHMHKVLWLLLAAGA